MKKTINTIKDLLTVLFLVVDLFCGAGGTTTGFAKTNIVKVIACVNHDKNAIKSHWLNHPGVKHFEEDIRTLDLTELIELVKKYRNLYPKAKVILWASLECTNYSKAKGGKPRDADSRSLADHLPRYVIGINPDIIQIENVVEFMAWGPLDETGRPISKKNGKDWVRWKNEMCALGYVDEWRELNAADYGAYTSRNRLFGMFAKDKSLICWPEPTHFKKPSTGNLFITGKKWKPVKEVLDLKDEGNSIFGRKKELSEKTLERIYAGLIKYVAGGDTSFIQKYFSGNPNSKVSSINYPAGAITTIDHHGIVQACFLTKYHSQGGQLNSIEMPGPTLPCKDSVAKIQMVWLDKNYTGPANHQSINQPAGTILSVPKMNLVQAEKFIMNTNYNNIGSSIHSPAPVLTASRRHPYLINPNFILNKNSSTAPSTGLEKPSPTITQRTHYLVNPQWGISNASIDKPCFTLIARMDKSPPYIVTTESGQAAIVLFETDCEAMKKIKQFMAAYGIIDIKMRMLKIPELLKIQGFPNEYKLIGTQTDQKKFIGNSVCPVIPEKWTYAIAEKLKIAA